MKPRKGVENACEKLVQGKPGKGSNAPLGLSGGLILPNLGLAPQAISRGPFRARSGHSSGSKTALFWSRRQLTALGNRP